MTNPNTRDSRGLAELILQETVIANPSALKEWVLLRSVRDKILHPFDRERLRLTYRAGNSWEALKDACKRLPFMVTRGDGLDMEVRITYVPEDKITTLNEALERIAHFQTVFAQWKEIGHKLLMAEEAIWNMREHVKASDARLMRGLALIFHYKNRAADLRQMLIDGKVSPNLLPNLDPPSQDELDKMWEGNLSDYGSLQLLLRDTGILEDKHDQQS